MTDSPAFPAIARFALQLQATDAAQPTRIAGRIEHVLSGRCRDFADVAGLLDCLAAEQACAALSLSGPVLRPVLRPVPRPIG